MSVRTLFWGAALIFAQPLANEDVLEPSVQNEVDCALARAPTNAPPVPAAVRAHAAVRALLSTNGATRTALAIRLVSAQKADGAWRVGTNDVTAAVLERLRALSNGGSAAP
jgi:hypothetical protein